MVLFSIAGKKSSSHLHLYCNGSQSILSNQPVLRALTGWENQVDNTQKSGEYLMFPSSEQRYTLSGRQILEGESHFPGLLFLFVVAIHYNNEKRIALRNQAKVQSCHQPEF